MEMICMMPRGNRSASHNLTLSSSKQITYRKSGSLVDRFRGYCAIIIIDLKGGFQTKIIFETQDLKQTKQLKQNFISLNM